MRRPLWRLLWNDKREAAFDVALVLGMVLLGRVLLVLYPTDMPVELYDWAGGLWLSDVVMWALDVAMLARRRYPLVFMTLVAVLSVAQPLMIEFGPGALFYVNLQSDPWVPAQAPWAVYAAVVHTAGRAQKFYAWDLIGIVTLVSVRPWAAPSSDVVVAGVVWTLFPAVLGLYISARRRLVGALRERAERAEREQELLAEQARADERARLAAEMHDVVTHRVSLMVLQAGALGVMAKDPETRKAAEELRSNGCEALEELRELVGVLRRGSPEEDERDAPPTSVPDFTELIGQSEAVGVPVEYTVEGDPAEVSAAVGRTAHRVVQEALTNVHKHAFGSRVSVRLLHSDDRLRLVVRNTEPPDPVAPELADSGSGSGLLGLQQRVELVGGTFRAGPTDDGGFEVDVILPAYVPTGQAGDDDG